MERMITFIVLLLSMCVFFLSDHMLSVHALHLIPSSSHMLHLIHYSHHPPFLTLLNSPTTATNPSDTILLLLDQLFLTNPHDSSSSVNDMNSLTIGSSSSSQVQVLVPPLVIPTTTYTCVYSSDPISSISEQIQHSTIAATHGMQSSSAIISQASTDLSLNGPQQHLQLQLQHLLGSLRDIIIAYATKYTELIASSSSSSSIQLSPSSASATAAPLPLIDLSVVSTLINEVIAALIRATSSFTTQLSQKGDELVANTQSSLNSFAASLPNDAINSAASSISTKVLSIGW